MNHKEHFLDLSVGQSLMYQPGPLRIHATICLGIKHYVVPNCDNGFQYNTLRLHQYVLSHICVPQYYTLFARLTISFVVLSLAFVAVAFMQISPSVHCNGWLQEVILCLSKFICLFSFMHFRNKIGLAKLNCSSRVMQ